MTGSSRSSGTCEEKSVSRTKIESENESNKEANSGGINRRKYLAFGASALGAMTLVPKAQAAETRHGVSFDNSYDVVADLGFDNSGNSPVDDKIKQHAEDGTLLKFPPGQYLITSQVAIWGIDNFGVVGTGDSRGDVEFVYPSGYTGRTFAVRKGSNWVFENFTVQQTDDEETGSLLVFQANDNLNVYNVETAGFTPYNTSSGINAGIWDSDGEGVIDGYVNRDGGAVGDYPDNSPGIYAGPNSNGTLYIRDTHLEEVGSNGIYASRTSGGVRVEGGLYKNNDIAAIRVCGPDSYVKGATIVVDTENTNNTDGSYNNPRGIWWESGHMKKSGGSVEDCELALLSSDNESGGLLNVAGTAGDLTVRNCRFQNKTRRPTIFASSVSSDVSGGTVDISGISIVGESSNPWLGAIELNGRPGSSVTDACIEGNSDGGKHDRDGVVLRDCGSATIQNCTIDVPGQTIVLDSTSANPSGISESGSCPAPSLDGSSDYSSSESSDDSDSDDAESESESEDSESEESSSEDSESEESGSEGSESSDSESESESSTSGKNSLIIKSNGGYASYGFSVSGTVEIDPDNGGGDHVWGSKVSGAVDGYGRDGYIVSGEFESFDVGTGARVYLNGNKVEASELNG